MNTAMLNFGLFLQIHKQTITENFGGGDAPKNQIQYGRNFKFKLEFADWCNETKTT